jgi:hypothetical protein
VKGERRWRKSKRRAERTRDEAAKELVVHPNVPSQEDDQETQRVQ